MQPAGQKSNRSCVLSRCPRLVCVCVCVWGGGGGGIRRLPSPPPRSSSPVLPPTTTATPSAITATYYLPCPARTNARADASLTSIHPSSLLHHARCLPQTNQLQSDHNGAAVAGVLRPQNGVGAGGRDGGGGRPAAGGPAGPGAGGAVLVAGVRGVAGGRRGGGAAGAGRRRRRGGGAGVPRGLLGLPRVEGPLREQRLDRAPEGLRGGAPPRHALHAAGRRAGPRALRRHRAGRARRRRARRAALPGARHEGDVPAAEPDDAAGVLHGHPAQQGGGRRRERDGGAVRERAGDGLRPRRQQGQVAAQRPRGPAPREGGGGPGGRLRQEVRVRDGAVRALGRVPRHQVRPRPLRPERRAAGARRPALRPPRQRLNKTHIDAFAWLSLHAGCVWYSLYVECDY